MNSHASHSIAWGLDWLLLGSSSLNFYDFGKMGSHEEKAGTYRAHNGSPISSVCYGSCGVSVSVIQLPGEEKAVVLEAV